MFASTAMAQSVGSAVAPAGAAPGGGPTDYIIQFAPLILLFVLFYFLMIRPQQRRAKLHAATIAGVKRGDTVVMSSGMIGKVTRVEDAEVAVEIAPNVTVKVVKSMISDVRTRGEPTPANDAPGSKKSFERGSRAVLQVRAWKIALVVAAALFGLLFTLPNLVPAGTMPGFLPGKRLNLGLDLQGGSYLLLGVDTAALRTETLNNLGEDIRRDLQTANLAFTGPVQQSGAVSVGITDPAKLPQAMTTLQPLNTADATGQRAYDVRQDGNAIRFTPNPAAANAAAGRAVEQSIEIIRRRIDQLGTREPSITRQGVDRIVVQAPGESDPERLKRVIGQTAKLTFQMVDEAVTPEAAKAGQLPPGDVLLPSEQSFEPNGVVVKKRVVVDGGMLTDARPGFDNQTGRNVVSFRFNGVGTTRFAEVSTQNVKKRFAIVLDNKVISDPVIQEPITGGSGQISGNFTTESANDLSVLLRAGALPAPLKVEQQQTVGAELGADAVKAGQVSTLLGFALICAFMILSYGLLFGGVSVIGLIINGLLIVAAMSVTQATLTLPGIAGLILTLAVAVDANVLIYERMREEARAGRTVLNAMNSGFSRAMVTIIDANVTTLVAALIMFVFGAGAVRGFAWTLSIGVFTSIFSAVMVSQVLLGLWFRRARPKTLPIS